MEGGGGQKKAVSWGGVHSKKKKEAEGDKKGWEPENT